MSTHSLPKLHNAMWPGLVGKGTGEGQEPPISLEHMLDLTAAAEVNGQKFEGIDYFLFLPHTNPEASDDELMKIADLIAGNVSTSARSSRRCGAGRSATRRWATRRSGRNSSAR